MPGTSWSTNLGPSCPSACAIGSMHEDQRRLVLPVTLLWCFLPLRCKISRGGCRVTPTRNGVATMAHIRGTEGVNTLNGTAQADLIEGFGGNDTLRGGAGRDILDGGKGFDTLSGMGDSDTFR